MYNLRVFILDNIIFNIKTAIFFKIETYKINLATFTLIYLSNET